jgi:hypothetical protein
MKERPILMRGPLVCASLKDKKWQTRRVVQPRVGGVAGLDFWGYDTTDADGTTVAVFGDTQGDHLTRVRCPYGQPGDRLWVRETFAIVPTTAYRASDGVHQTVNPCDPDDAAIYRAGWDRSEPGVRWRPSIHMPRWASRLTLEITGVRVERIRDISLDDMRAEGVRPEHEASLLWRESLTERFIALWDSINAARGYSWDVNPYVWVISYTRVTP